MRTVAEEMSAPKYAHMERERRWLVDMSTRPTLENTPFVSVKDNYIEDSRLRLRRMIDSATGQQSLKLTKKYETADPLARPIVTAYLDEAEYALLARLPSRCLAKRRYEIADGNQIFSLDIFEGMMKGLELAEIEQACDADLRTVSPPAWTHREVSDDVRYQGGMLVQHGVPQE
jgi:CYTH domain-containing protein